MNIIFIDVLIKMPRSKVDQKNSKGVTTLTTRLATSLAEKFGQEMIKDLLQLN